MNPSKDKCRKADCKDDILVNYPFAATSMTIHPHTICRTMQMITPAMCLKPNAMHLKQLLIVALVVV